MSGLPTTRGQPTAKLEHSLRRSEVSDVLYIQYTFLQLILCPRYLYILSVSIDACFRLKRRAVSSEVKDPILGSGWGYFMEDTGYKELLAARQEENEVRKLLTPCISARLRRIPDIVLHRTISNRPCEHEIP